MNKQDARNAIATKLNTLQPSELHTKHEAIYQRLLADIDWTSIQRVSCYQSKEQLREVDTTRLIELLRSELGVDVDKAPSTHTATQPSATYDAIIVPIVAFDDTCNRLGRGGGWYDRFLATQTHALKIGLAYELQHLTAIPCEPHDIALDSICTEKTTYHRNKVGLKD